MYGKRGSIYRLDGPGMESQWGVRFSAPVQTGAGAHPASHTMGTASFPVVKWPGRAVDHPLPYSAEVKESVELYLYSTSGPSWPVIGCILPLPLRGEAYKYIVSAGAISFVHPQNIQNSRNISNLNYNNKMDMYSVEHNSVFYCISGNKFVISTIIRLALHI